MWKEAVVVYFNVLSPGGADENTEMKIIIAPAEIRTLDRRTDILTECFRPFPHSLLANSGIDYFLSCFIYIPIGVFHAVTQHVDSAIYNMLLNLVNQYINLYNLII
jgi:hypothetical protein